jgi:hypothetical protein
MHYQARVTGKSVFDRLLRGFVGSEVDVSITSWGGPLVLVTGFFRRAPSTLALSPGGRGEGARSYILIAAPPLEDGRTQVEVIVMAERSRLPVAKALVQPINLWLRRLFTVGFMRDDIDRLGSIRYNPMGLIESDRELLDFFRWAAELPGSFREDCTERRTVAVPASSAEDSAEKPGRQYPRWLVSGE